MTQTLIKPQAMDSTTRLASKVITATRDGVAASGDVAYTGVGFIPTSIIALMNVNGALYQSIGIVDSSKVSQSNYLSAADVVFQSGNFITYSNQSSWAQGAVVKSFDTDGFTLTWTKIGSPTANTMLIVFLCFK